MQGHLVIGQQRQRSQERGLGMVDFMGIEEGIDTQHHKGLQVNWHMLSQFVSYGCEDATTQSLCTRGHIGSTCFAWMHLHICLVYTFDCSRLVSWWATALCLAILSHLSNLLLHRENKCGQVLTLSLIWHNVQLGLRCVCGQKNSFL